MSVDRDPLEPGARDSAGDLIARAAMADARAERRLSIIAEELVRGDDDRLDDEMRAILNETLDRLVSAIEADIRHHAERVLAPELKHRLASRQGLLARLLNAGLIDDRGLQRELVARARMAILARALPAVASDQPDRPSLTSRLATGPDRVVAAAATAMMMAEGRRSAAEDGRNDFPADYHHRFVWWVAAALRRTPVSAAIDRALVEAAQRVLAAHDEGVRLEATAMRLALALDVGAEELPALLEESLADRRLVLFVALVAQGLGVNFELTRDLILDPDGDRLWLALRALDLGREPIARIGLVILEADRRRDARHFDDLLDTIVAISPDAARAALAVLKLPPDYRAALHRLEQAR